MSTSSDETLMTRLKAGDMYALGVLYKQHGAMVKGAIRRYAPMVQEDELLDMVQDVFLKLKRSAKHYRETGRFKAWLFGIAVQTAKNWKKTGAVRSALLSTHQSKPVALSLVVDNSPEQIAVNRDLLSKLLGRLPENQREVLILHEVDGFNAREIAEILNVSESAVWTRLHRGRNAILAQFHKEEKRLAKQNISNEATS